MFKKSINASIVLELMELSENESEVKVYFSTVKSVRSISQ